MEKNKKDAEMLRLEMQNEYVQMGKEIPITILRAEEFFKAHSAFLLNPEENIKPKDNGFAIVNEIKLTFENQLAMLQREK